MSGKKKMIFGLVTGLIVALMVSLGIRTSLQAQDKASGGDNSEKFEQILQGQKSIAQDIASIKEQLNAIQLHTNKL